MGVKMCAVERIIGRVDPLRETYTQTATIAHRDPDTLQVKNRELTIRRHKHAFDRIGRCYICGVSKNACTCVRVW